MEVVFDLKQVFELKFKKNDRKHIARFKTEIRNFDKQRTNE